MGKDAGGRPRQRSGRRGRSGLLRLLGLVPLLAGCGEEPPASPPAPVAAVEPRVGAGDPPPVVLIVVDTLRADRLGAYGYERPTSPFLDQWCERGRVFENALTTSPWTLPSMASILTGRLPSRHAAGSVVELEDDTTCAGLADNVTTLAEVLRDHGWRTAAMVNNTFLSPEFGVHRGFQHYDFEATSELRTRRSDEMVDGALDWIDEQEDSRFFLMLHLFDPHTAYDPPERARGRFTRGLRSRLEQPVTKGAVGRYKREFSPEDRRFVSGSYDEEVSFVATEIHRLLQGLDERGVLEHGLVALTADHGEELFEHGGFSHGHALWQSLLHVPLVFWGRGVQPGREDDPASVVDLSPTVLEFLDLPRGEREGRSLWANLREGRPLPERSLHAEFCMYGGERKAVFRWPTKVVFEAEGDGRRVTDLDRDPAEEASSTELGPEARTLVEEAAAYLEQLAAQAESSTRVISPEVMEGIRALGYADDPTRDPPPR